MLAVNFGIILSLAYQGRQDFWEGHGVWMSWMKWKEPNVIWTIPHGDVVHCGQTGS